MIKAGFLRKTCPRVAVAFDLSVESARGIIRGILKFVRENTCWHINYFGSDTCNITDETLRDLRCDGIITRVTLPETFRQIMSLHCPTVLLTEETFSEKDYDGGHPVFVRCDDHAIGKMAAQFFLDRNFHSFACVAYPVREYHWCRNRRQGYVNLLKQNGFSCANADFNGQNWTAKRELMIEWLRSLPTPLALFVTADSTACQVLECCQQGGIQVPYDVAVISVHNDELVCQMCYPSLSSIAVDWERAGFISAKTLESLFRGESTPSEKIYKPIQVVARNSTEHIRVNDPLVVRILELIRINQGRNLQVTEIAKILNVSRRTAQQRFKNAMGTSMIEEIKRVRMDHVCLLLRSDEYSILDVAQLCGFENANHLGVVFRKEFGMTMGQYRARVCHPE